MADRWRIDSQLLVRRSEAMADQFSTQLFLQLSAQLLYRETQDDKSFFWNA